MRLSISKWALVWLMLCCSTVYATPLFNVSASAGSLIVSTVTSNHTYPGAGIKINTPGYSLSGIGTDCVLDGNGYCLFSVSDTQSKNFTIAGVGGPISVSLCLHGLGPTSCQEFKNITFTASVAKYIYIDNDSGPVVYVCALDPVTGLMSPCIDAGGGSAIANIGPVGITLNSTSTMAYITAEVLAPYMFQCAIDPLTRTFSACSEIIVTAPSGYYPYYGMIALNTSNTLAYLVDSTSGGRVLACPLTNGTLGSNCTNTGAYNIAQYSTGIILNNASNTAYISNGYSNNTVTVCSVSNATFSNCLPKSGGGAVTFSAPYVSALNSSGSTIYITDSGQVYGCATAGGTSTKFASCFVAAPSIPSAFGIVINAQSTMAYVTDYLSNTYQCPILQDGTFGACTINATLQATVQGTLAY